MGKDEGLGFGCCLYGVHAQTENLGLRPGRDGSSLRRRGTGSAGPAADQC